MNEEYRHYAPKTGLSNITVQSKKGNDFFDSFSSGPRRLIRQGFMAFAEPDENVCYTLATGQATACPSAAQCKEKFDRWAATVRDKAKNYCQRKKKDWGCPVKPKAFTLQADGQLCNVSKQCLTYHEMAGEAQKRPEEEFCAPVRLNVQPQSSLVVNASSHIEGPRTAACCNKEKMIVVNATGGVQEQEKIEKVHNCGLVLLPPYRYHLPIGYPFTILS